MKFTVYNLIINVPDPQTGTLPTQHERIEAVISLGRHVEQLGFDAYQIGERHGAPFLCSAPTVLLTAVAAQTHRIKLLTGVTVLPIHDPVMVAEEYAMLDHLSEGRLELVIAKGNHAPHYSIFGLNPDEQWDVLEEKYYLLKKLWSEEGVSWSGRYRGPLEDVTTHPRPYQDSIRIWHGSSTSTRTTELAARNGDPLFSANGFFPADRYIRLIDQYRTRWSDYGHKGRPLLGVGFPAVLIREKSQDAVEAYRPFWNSMRDTPAAKHNGWPFWELEEFMEQGSALIGSPQQVIEKLQHFCEIYDHQLTTISVDQLPSEWQHEQLERFASDVLPPIRAAYPNSLWS